MTEEDAKSRWCPEVRYPNLMAGGMVASNIYSDGCNVNIDGDRTPPAFCCIASGCMYGCDTEGNWLGHCGLIRTE